MTDTNQKPEITVRAPDGMTAEKLMQIFGVRYFNPGCDPVMWESSDSEQYHYNCFVGEHRIEVPAGDSIWWLRKLNNQWEAYVQAGPFTIKSDHFAVVVRGYKAPTAMRAFGDKGTVLPYVNGCSTDQIFPPRRLGDPTLQHLIIPPFSAEQAHHIHSTVRAVYVLRGRGVSVVGMEGAEVKTELVPGMVCILDPMCPHHFETPQGEAIEVIPFHVFSAVPGENQHPMMRGTFLMDQGG